MRLPAIIEKFNSTPINQQRQIQPAASLGLFIDKTQVGFDCAFTNIKVGGDLKIRLPLATRLAISRSCFVKLSSFFPGIWSCLFFCPGIGIKYMTLHDLHSVYRKAEKSQKLKKFWYNHLVPRYNWFIHGMLLNM